MSASRISLTPFAIGRVRLLTSKASSFSSWKGATVNSNADILHQRMTSTLSIRASLRSTSMNCTRNSPNIWHSPPNQFVNAGQSVRIGVLHIEV